MKIFIIAFLLMPIGIYAQTGGTWTPTELTNAPKARTESKAVWTGTKMIVWGGKDSSGYLKSGAIYDPATNKWKTMATAPLLGRSSHAMLWTGTELIVWGGRGRYGTPQKNRLFHDGARYNPNTDTWTSIYIYNDPYCSCGPINKRGNLDFSSIWTGTEMLIWGGGTLPAIGLQLIHFTGTALLTPHQIFGKKITQAL